jgi:DNA mismatch endonuclease, patch repair protein
MADVFTSKKRSEVMSLIRSKNTKPEIKTRSALHCLGFRFRVHDSSLPGKPDIVLRKHRTVIHVRGCFWHGHQCKIARHPNSHQEYWLPKIQRNIERDLRNDQLLKKEGWRIKVIWECDCRKADKLSRIVKDLADELRVTS